MSEVIRKRVGEDIELVGFQRIDWSIRISRRFLDELKIAVAKLNNVSECDVKIVSVDVAFRIGDTVQEINLYSEADIYILRLMNICMEVIKWLKHLGSFVLLISVPLG